MLINSAMKNGITVTNFKVTFYTLPSARGGGFSDQEIPSKDIWVVKLKWEFFTELEVKNIIFE